MKWVLLFAFASSYSVSQIEPYRSLEACQRAGKEVEAAVQLRRLVGNNETKFICVPVPLQ
jgi:hypothetical protein